jgi:predicted ATPase/class 3 adenylate cyclase
MSRRRGLIERFRGRRPSSSRTVRPTGTVTFVLTDIEGSTRLWETQPDAMERAIGRHGAIVADAVERRGGTLVRERGEGDSTFSVFPHAPDAIAAALEIQRALTHEPWDPGTELRVRVAMHTGDAYLISDDEYASPVINRCARIREIAYGGQVLISEHTLQLVDGALPSGASVLDLGPHRLRDLSRPVRIFQLQHPELPQTFPKLRSLEAGLHNLPVQLTSFIGREREVEEVRKHLAATRALNLVGPGGIGKTRLALQAAGDLAERYPDGIWFVDLAPVTDPGMVPQAVASALSLREEAGRTVLESVIDHLRSAHALITLDNCEHLTAAASEFATSLLRSCVEISVLATGREALRVPGATTWHVPTMAVPDGAVPTEALGEFEAVRLFAERAGLARPEFALTHETGPIVARICAKLDGVPLAIELAAANVASMSVSDIETRLDDRFRSLTRGGPDVPRHGTLQATVDWSHDLLNEKERVLFRRLSVFVGGFTLEGAEEVCSDEPLVRDEIVYLLTDLVDKSLVALDEVFEDTRYTMLETLREYASRKLIDAGEQEATLDRHASYFRSFGERVTSILEGPDEAAHLRALENELPNIRRALATLYGSDRDDGLELAARLVHFWSVRGFQSEAIALLSKGLARDDVLDPALEARARLVAGILLRQQGHLPKARTMIERSVELRREHGTAKDVSETLVELGNALHQMGEQGAAERAYTEGVELARGADADRQIVGALNGLGIIAISSGRPADAAPIYDEIVACARRLGMRRGLASALGNRGLAAFELGDNERARAHTEEALQIAREIGDERFTATLVLILGAIALELGDIPRAAELSEQSLALARELDDPVGEAQSLYRLGELARADRRLTDGARLLEQSLVHSRRLGIPDMIANAVLSLGLTARLAGDTATARDRLTEAAGIFETIDAIDGRSRCADGLAAVIIDNDARTAAILLAAAATVRERTGATLPAFDVAVVEADVARVRELLGPQAFEAAWDEGARMTLEDAFARFRALYEPGM